MEFQAFKKIPRLSRDIIITEKIDGTNAQIYIEDETDMNWIAQSLDDVKKYVLAQVNGFNIYAGSKNRWLDCSSKGDNFGFAKWVKENAEELIKLGQGRHFGEWYGKGIQRGYGLDEKRFALFNVGKWINHYECYSQDYKGKILDSCPKCCSVVPILYEGMFDTNKINEILEKLRIDGSSAEEGYLMPEGIVIFHKASGQLFKKTIMNDEKPKGKG